MTKYSVIGAGLAGLYAAALLRNECSSVHELQSELPNNHRALLRFRTNEVGKALNIPFKEVSVVKQVHTSVDKIQTAINYSLKTTGSILPRSVLSADGQTVTRYVAPADLVQKIYDRTTCAYHFHWDAEERIGQLIDSGRNIISTLPMNLLALILDYPFKDDLECKSVSGYSRTVELVNCDFYGTIYVADPDIPFYRVSFVGDRIIVEYAQRPDAGLGEDNFEKQLYDMLNLNDVHHLAVDPCPPLVEQRYAKILPIDDRPRKEFIHWATSKFGIFSFGRFATWRPGLLMDDLAKDLSVIQDIANSGQYQALRRS